MIEEKKFQAILIVLIPQIIDNILKFWQMPEELAVEQFYCSKVYKALEDRETNLWHLSPLTLCNMFLYEQNNGHVNFPEEAN